MDGKFKILLIFLLGCIGLKAQTFTYNYTDPCTGILQSVTLSQSAGTVVMFYAGQYQTFTAAQLQSGAYENWIAQINSQFPPGSNPCAGNGSSNANNSNANIGTSTANNVSGIVSISTGIAGSLGGNSVGSTSIGGTNGSSSTSGNSSNDNNGDGNSGSSSGGSTSTGSGGSSGSSSGNGSSGSSGGSNSGGSGGGSSGGSGGSGGSGSSGGGSTGGSGGSGGGQTGDNSGGGIGGGGTGGDVNTGGSGGTTETGSTESGGLGGNESTTTASGGDSESGGDSGGGGGGKPKQKQEKIGRGSLIGSGDMVIVRNGSDIKASGMDNYRFNMSLTHVNTKQTFIKGANLNYTTGENIASVTLYGSYKTKTFMGVGSNSTMSNFKSDWFNTTTLLGAQKLWKFTFMGGTNFTVGQIGESGFQNWSIVAGGFTGFNGSKSFTVNVMALGVYSPYIFYYEGQWYKSGILLVPLANIDFKLTDKFKWSISFSGAYQYKADILNFQLSTGTKMLL